MERRTLPVNGGQGTILKPTTKSFYDKDEADAYANDIRSYVANGIEYGDNDERNLIYYVPL